MKLVDVERFWSRVLRGAEDDCWLYMGPGQSEPRASARFYFDGVSDTAPRVAWELANNREVPDDLFICHHCDNPPCCNPKHLIAATPSWNTKDMLAKKRGAEFMVHAHRAGAILKSIAVQRRAVLSDDQRFVEYGVLYWIGKLGHADCRTLADRILQPEATRGRVHSVLDALEDDGWLVSGYERRHGILRLNYCLTVKAHEAAGYAA